MSKMNQSRIDAYRAETQAIFTVAADAANALHAANGCSYCRRNSYDQRAGEPSSNRPVSTPTTSPTTRPGLSPRSATPPMPLLWTCLAEFCGGVSARRHANSSSARSLRWRTTNVMAGPPRAAWPSATPRS